MAAPDDVDLATYLKRTTPTSSKPAEWESFNYWSNTPRFMDASSGVVSRGDRPRSSAGLPARDRPRGVPARNVIDVRSVGLASAAAALVLVGLGFDQAKPADGTAVRFRNVASAAGLNFTHNYSQGGGKYFVESAPGGLAVFDYNGDGRPDIFFTNGAETPSLQKTSAVYSNRLYRNDGNMAYSPMTSPRSEGLRLAVHDEP